MTEASAPSEQPEPPDRHAWLEVVLGEAALDWVRQRNAESRAELCARPEFAPSRDRLRALLDAPDRIPSVSRRGDWLYNLWQDQQHPRGLWRRTTLAQFRLPQPDWQTLLDLDALGRQEGQNWVWQGVKMLAPDWQRGLISLSRGGADACVVREFDLPSLAFVEPGFVLPEAKSRVEWCDADTLYIGTDTGPGSLTDSGYPRTIRRWRRGTPLADAALVFEGQRSDVSVWFSVDPTPGFERTVFGRQLDFYRDATALLVGDGLRPIAKPEDAELSFWQHWVLLALRSDCKRGEQHWPSGSLLAADARAFMDGGGEFTALFMPTPTRSLAGHCCSASMVLLSILDNVAGAVEVWRPDQGSEPGKPVWRGRSVAVPTPGSIGITTLHDPQVPHDPLAEAYLLAYSDYLMPDTLWLADTGNDRREPLRARPAAFDASGLRAVQHSARSADGTAVPYVVVGPADVGSRPRPTVLYGYGGFEISLQPVYAATWGAPWLERGGVLVVANLRGGGEFGPSWHQAAIGANKQRSYDDFIAVAQDLVARGISTPEQLGSMGGSNGGLLVAAVAVQRPELFGAVVCKVPLLDMRRYHRLLAGASWMAEYGDPDDPAQWAWIARYSPYHNVSADRAMPPMLLSTSTRDDRVHPGHARKMAARLREFGHPALYHENIEGGHGGAADNAQRADAMALEFAFLWSRLGPPS